MFINPNGTTQSFPSIQKTSPTGRGPAATETSQDPVDQAPQLSSRQNTKEAGRHSTSAFRRALATAGTVAALGAAAMGTSGCSTVGYAYAYPVSPEPAVCVAPEPVVECDAFRCVQTDYCNGMAMDSMYVARPAGGWVDVSVGGLNVHERGWHHPAWGEHGWIDGRHQQPSGHFPGLEHRSEGHEHVPAWRHR